jgi:NAD(P)-dependent dehydrogenase (short-subunit alcohol dehydrogenase family)
MERRDIVLITGGASGIGAGAARRLARRMRVIIADRDIDRARDLSDELNRAGAATHALAMDVGNGADVRQAVARASRDFGPIHFLFSNAGINIRQPVEAIAPQDWAAMMNTHVKGGFLVAQAVLPRMVADRRGGIVFTSSDFAVIGMANGAAYAAAKTALYSLAKSLAVEFAPYGIRVNALGPGPIDTPLLRTRPEPEWQAAQARFRQIVPMQRLGSPDEVAALLDFLLSDRSSYITGQLLHPNGGQVMW